MSRATTKAAILCVFAVALGACADQPDHLPTEQSVAFQTGGVGPACNLVDLRKATEAVFGKRSPEVELAQQFTNRNYNTPAVTNVAFDLLGELAAEPTESWTSTQVTAGAELAVQVIACADLVYTDAQLPGTTGQAARGAFVKALASGGTFEVRGAGANESPVEANDGQAGLRPVEYPTDFARWLAGGRALVIGYEIPAFSAENHGGYAYDWSFVRPRTGAGSGPLVGLAEVSLCADAPTPAAGDRYRIQHLPNGNIIPTASGVPLECSDDVGTAAAAPAGFAARLLRVVGDAVTPAPLFAAVAAYGPVSGLLGSFSPLEVVDPGELVMAFTRQPVDVAAGATLPVAVSVKAAAGTPWAGVDVYLTAMANNGVPLELCGAHAVTGDDGVAHFNMQLSKPGGVYLTASTRPTDDPDADAYPATTVESNRFIVGPGTSTLTCPPS